MEIRIDTLKPLDAITAPDERWQNLGRLDMTSGRFIPHSLEQRHSSIAAINLNESVPDAIRERFETAKNLLLYAWYVYRFIPVAELHAYATVEMALRLRAKQEKLEGRPGKKGQVRDFSLKELLNIAIRRRWLTDDAFEATRIAADGRSEEAQRARQVDIEIAPEPEDAGVQHYCKVLCETMPALRNDLAHGSATLHPGGFYTLRICRDLINQLFPVVT